MKKVRKGYRKPRVKRPVEKNLIKGYDSNWEYELHSGILDAWEFHVDKVEARRYCSKQRVASGTVQNTLSISG